MQPDIIFKLVHTEELLNFAKQTNVTETLIKLVVGALGKVRNIKNNTIEIIIKLIPIENKSNFLLKSFTVGQNN